MKQPAAGRGKKKVKKKKKKKPFFFLFYFTRLFIYVCVDFFFRLHGRLLRRFSTVVGRDSKGWLS